MPVTTKTRPKAAPTTPPRTIRDPEFAKRLHSACDANPHCPPMHKGRLTWLERELESRFKEDVSIETCRKWFQGEAKPRPDKLAKIAELLQVDVAWLSLGVDPTLMPRERKARNAMADGAVNVIAGLIQMDGGYPAFPEETDTQAQRNKVDLHAIIRGAKYDFHISLATDEGFVVPTTYENLVVLGVVKKGFSFEIYEIEGEVISAGVNRGGSIVVPANTRKLRRIESFAQRLP